jgi:ferritin
LVRKSIRAQEIVLIDPKVEKAINEQINKELYSYYLYLSMAAYFESNNLKGFAHWMRIQGGEEQGHAMKLYEYVFERGGRVALQSIQAPPFAWKSPAETFEDAYKHEQVVTASINQLVELAKLQKDNATEVFLQWFVKEQVEEEATAYEITQKLKMVGNEGAALFMLDSELGKRAPAKT